MGNSINSFFWKNLFAAKGLFSKKDLLLDGNDVRVEPDTTEERVVEAIVDVTFASEVVEVVVGWLAAVVDVVV